MAKRRRSAADEQTEILRTILIVQLATAGVPQREIRTIARCDMNRVTEIVSRLRARNNKAKGRAGRGQEKAEAKVEQ
jgi:hypothetical protein